MIFMGMIIIIKKKIALNRNFKILEISVETMIKTKTMMTMKTGEIKSKIIMIMMIMTDIMIEDIIILMIYKVCRTNLTNLLQFVK